MKSRSIRLIIAEDDLDDRLLMEDALNDIDIDIQSVQFVEDGDQLLYVLKNSESLPHLIMLDLNMPKKDGREALREIRADNLLKHIPVIVFTTSNSIEDIRFAYIEGGNTFITKPSLYSDLVETLGIVKSYWFDKAALASEM